MIRYPLLLLAIAVLLGGCTTLRETEPGQTARHQLLLSTAADEASQRISPNLPAGTSVFVNTDHFGSSDDYQSSYAIGAIRAAILKQGYNLAASADEADTIAEVSSGALSIDRRERLLGVPSASVPIPLAGPFKTPEISFWKSKERTGVAKFRLTFYDAETGALQDASDPVYGFSHFDRSSILFFGSTDSNLMPPEVEDRRESNAGTQD